MNETKPAIASSDPLARAWWAGVAEGRIGYQRCEACAAAQFFPRERCEACGSAHLAVATSAGTGTIFSITVVHRPPSPALQAFAPYGIALVDLDEGVRLMAHADPGLAIGEKVVATFAAFGDRATPKFIRAT